MKKNLLLYILLIFLIIMNAFFLYNYIGDNKSGRADSPKEPRDFIAKELGFNETQLKRFNELNKAHHQNMQRLSGELRALKDELFNELPSKTVNARTIDSIASLIGTFEKKKDLEVFRHFKNVQKICDDKQKEKFNGIIQDALRKGMGPERRPPNNIEGGHRPPHKMEGGQRPPPPQPPRD